MSGRAPPTERYFSNPSSKTATQNACTHSLIACRIACFEPFEGCDNCNVMVQAWWAAGLAVPVVLIRGLVTNNNKAKQKESQNDRLPAAVAL